MERLDDRWVAPAEAARRLGVCGRRVRQLLDAGQLASVKTPLGSRLVDRVDLDRLVAERASKADEKAKSTRAPRC